jgi:hypothetical protein
MGRVLSREILLHSGVPTHCKNAEGHIRLLSSDVDVSGIYRDLGMRVARFAVRLW